MTTKAPRTFIEACLTDARRPHCTYANHDIYLGSSAGLTCPRCQNAPPYMTRAERKELFRKSTAALRDSAQITIALMCGFVCDFFKRR